MEKKIRTQEDRKGNKTSAGRRGEKEKQMLCRK